MRTLTPLTIAALALALAACGDDGDGGATIDAAIDAATVIDAPAATGQIGATCTGTGQGTCAAGFTCLTLTGGSGSWCSKRCADVQDPSCEDGYTGPGFAACIFKIDFPGGEQDVPHCAVVCDDPAGGPMICPGGAQQCNGMCPGTLQCTANLTNMQTMMVVGKACL